jgi:hypothetical protein
LNRSQPLKERPNSGIFHSADNNQISRENVRGNFVGYSQKGAERALDYLGSTANDPAMIVARP